MTTPSPDPYCHEIPWRRLWPALGAAWRTIKRGRRWLMAPVSKPPDRLTMIALWYGWAFALVTLADGIVRKIWP